MFSVTELRRYATSQNVSARSSLSTSPVRVLELCPEIIRTCTTNLPFETFHVLVINTYGRYLQFWKLIQS